MMIHFFPDYHTHDPWEQIYCLKGKASVHWATAYPVRAICICMDVSPNWHDVIYVFIMVTGLVFIWSCSFAVSTNPTMCISFLLWELPHPPLNGQVCSWWLHLLGVTGQVRDPDFSWTKQTLSSCNGTLGPWGSSPLVCSSGAGMWLKDGSG